MTRDKYNLPGPKNDQYWTQLRARAAELKSDGCTCVIDFYKDTCLEHDVHWRDGKTIFGQSISMRDANACFREAIQQRSKLHKFNPISWVRWVGVSADMFYRYITKEKV